MELNVKEIIIGDRIREDLGDVDKLVESISEIGLLHPIVVKQKGDEYFLLAGRRRLEAFMKMGKETIPVTVVSLEDVLRAEIHENMVRENFTFQEMRIVRREFEPEIEAQNKKIMIEAHASSGKLPELKKGARTRDVMASYLGMSPRQYQKFRDIDDAITENPDKFGDYAERIDKGMSIDYAHKMINTHEKSNTPTPDLPDDEFECLYMDLPWKYDLPLVGAPPYKTMSLQEIKDNIPVLPLAKDAVVFMWVTNPKLDEAMELVKFWGLTYKTNCVWIKTREKKLAVDEVDTTKLQAGTGYYLKGAHELLFICTKGSPGVPPEDVRVPSVVFAERTAKHSEKPKMFYDLIESYYPAKKKLEMFARNRREGWSSWGDEAST